MAGKRQRANPSAIRAQIDAIENPTGGLPSAFGPIRRLLTCVFANVLTVVLLSFSFAPYDAWYLAFVAFVPWALALGGTREGWLAIGERTSEIFRHNQPAGLLLKLLTAIVRVIVSPGVLFWGVNLYWLSWVTGIGYVGLVFYLWLYWLAATAVIRPALRRGWPMWLVLPVAWVALEYIRTYVISGFPWFYLAHTQYAQARLIQIADLTGQYGVSFFVAMVNGVIVDLVRGGLPAWLMRKGPAPGRKVCVGVGVTGAVAVVLLGYGTWRLGQQTTTPGPVIGLVQEAFPIALGKPTEEKKVVRRYIETSRALAGRGCDLVIWPETMLPRFINAEALAINVDKIATREELRALAKEVFGPGATAPDGDFKASFGADAKPAEIEAKWDDMLRDLLQRRFHDKPAEPPKDYWVLESRLQDKKYLSSRCYAADMAHLSRELQCPVLAGGSTLHRNPSPLDAADQWLAYNSALVFDGAEAASFEYDKVHLVPFSEYVPFKRSWPWLNRLLRMPVPDVMDQLEPGTRFDAYELKRGGKSWRIATPICYEGVFDRVCREMVVRDGKKAVDILANISNDGWFVWPFWGRGASNEQAQHLAQYCFRAVECRVPVVRAVNTGISASIDSNGRLAAVLSHNGQREMIAGAMLLKDKASASKDHSAGPQILVDSRVSVYSLVGDVFAIAVSAAAAIMCIGMILRRPRAEKRDTK